MTEIHLRRKDADRGRENSRKLAMGHRPYRGQPTTFPPDTTPKRCECEKPWSDGDGCCCYCGKTLAPAA